MNATATPAMPAFLLRQLGLHAGTRALLEGIDAQLPLGRFTAIVGPNGAGKSSLLKLLAGLQAPSQGQVLLHGLPLAAMPLAERARQLGWLGQFAAADLPLSLHDYVLLGLRPTLGSFGQASAPDLARVASALQQFDLLGAQQRRWGQLSGGERQRAGLARLLVQDAPLWLLDEPTNHLDLKHQALLFRRLRAEVAQGRTIVAVLHDLPQAARWADHVLLLGEGRLLAQGAPADCLSAAELSLAYQWPVRLWPDAAGHWQLAVGEVA